MIFHFAFTGLVPIFINANSGKFRKHSTITFGARGDSYYEYLLKQWIQTGKRTDYLRDDFLEAMRGVIWKSNIYPETIYSNCNFQVVNQLARRTVPNRLLYIGEIISSGKDFKPKMDELVSLLNKRFIQLKYFSMCLSFIPRHVFCLEH